MLLKIFKDKHNIILYYFIVKVNYNCSVLISVIKQSKQQDPPNSSQLN